MKSKILKIPVILDRYSRKKDRSYAITLITSLEVSKDKRDLIDELWQQEMWCILAPNELKEIEIPKEQAKVKDTSPMQRLVARMYVYWQQKKKETNPSFSLWLESQAESLGQMFLDKLNK
jgi:hypothetical protein